jgi:hypothetical protein
MKTIHKELSGAKNGRKWQNSLGSFYATLNNDCLAQERLRKLKLVWLELSGYGDFGYSSIVFWHVC